MFHAKCIPRKGSRWFQPRTTRPQAVDASRLLDAILKLDERSPPPAANDPPHRVDVWRMHWVVAFWVAWLAPLVASQTYTQSGDCYSQHGISVKSCDDVGNACGSSTCSGGSGYITFQCQGPITCTGTATRDTSAPTVTPASGSGSSPGTYNGYDQAGTCYTNHNLKVTSCDDLNGVCTDRTCMNANGEIRFTCSPPYSCWGTAAPATPAPTPWTEELSDCIRVRKLQLATCADTTPLDAIGCKCFNCNEENGYITVACTAPFQCSNKFNGMNAVPEAPELDTTDYAIFGGVYVAVAGIFAVVAWWTRPKQPTDPAAPKQSLVAKILAFLAPANLGRLAVKWVADAFASYMLEPNTRSDGTMTTFCEFWASMNLWVSLLSQFIGCARPRNPPPNYKPPMGWGHALAQLFTDTSIAVSLAFLVGTVVNNSEACNSVINGDFCQQGGVTISSKVLTSTSNGQCQSVDMAKTTMATVLTTVVTKVVGGACEYAEGTAKRESKRMSMMLAGRVVVTVALLVFGVGYSFKVNASESGSKEATRRHSTIGAVLLPSWVADQATSVFGVLVQRVGIFLVCLLPKQARAATKADQATGAAIRPTTNARRLQPPGGPFEVASNFSNISSPSAPSLSALVYETDDATQVKSTTVRR